MIASTLTKPRWFAIQTKSRHEKIVAQQLDVKGYEQFLPTYHARRQWSDRIQILELPLFDGYLFCRIDMSNTARVITTPGVFRIPGAGSPICRIDMNNAARVITTPGVIRIRGDGRNPIAVADAEVEALQQLLASQRQLAPWPYLPVGQRVRIVSGLLTGVEGVLRIFGSRRRLIISVTLLQRSVAVEVDRDAVWPIDAGGITASLEYRRRRSTASGPRYRIVAPWCRHHKCVYPSGN